MTKINLLDWRAERRKLREKKFFTLMMLSGALAALLCLLVYGYIGNRIDYQQGRNRILTQKIADIDKQIKEIQELEKVKANLISRMNVIQELQASRSATVHFFDEVINTLPDGVYLTALRQTGDNVTIEGIAESNGRVSAYMKNLDASPWFDDPRLVVIQTSQANNTRHSAFTLQVKNLTKAGGNKKSGGAG